MPIAGAADSLSPFQLLPHDALLQVFSFLPLRQAILCRCVCRSFRDSLLSPPPSLPSLPLLALRNRSSSSSPSPPPPHLVAFDPVNNSYLRFPLSFLPFPSLSPIASSNSLLYLWADPLLLSSYSPSQQKNPKSLIVCNPVTRSYKILPRLGSAWSRHGTVLVGPDASVLVLTELAALYYSPTNANTWLKYSLNLSSKPRSPILIGNSIFTLCDVGSPWRSQWKLFSCKVEELKVGKGWVQLEKEEWGDVFDVLKRPRLVRGGVGANEILMVGGLRSGFGVDSPCLTVLILRLNLERMDWDEAGRMPQEMYRCFANGGGGGVNNQGGAAGNNKVKVFGGDGRVWFSGKRVRGKMAMWEEEGGGGGGGSWRWVDGVAGYGDGVYRGFVFDAGLTEVS